MSIKIKFQCGHDGLLSDSVSMRPVCHCGEQQITAVYPSRAPRFTGTVTGPCAVFKALDPGVVNVAPAGALKLKESSDAHS